MKLNFNPYLFAPLFTPRSPSGRKPRGWGASRRPSYVPKAYVPVINTTDRGHLERYDAECDPRLEPYLSRVLRNTLNAPTVEDADLPSDAVSGGATVRYTIDDGPEQVGLLCHQSRTLGTNGVIAAFSLLGVTLIGMRVGQRAPLVHRCGKITAVTVLGVTH
ncbi:hypothetical protein [Pararhodobacter oceanensis]|uniref:hypothetical protein n=1 Tax=Pararhodobacter oceanensis TaxID=2172121 RepID=UPI003A940657